MTRQQISRQLVGKSQNVRLVDVFLLGPFMVWAGTQRALPSWARTLLVLSGVATVAYNFRNWQRIRRLEPWL